MQELITQIFPVSKLSLSKLFQSYLELLWKDCIYFHKLISTSQTETVIYDNIRLKEDFVPSNRILSFNIIMKGIILDSLKSTREANNPGSPG